MVDLGVAGLGFMVDLGVAGLGFMSRDWGSWWT